MKSSATEQRQPASVKPVAWFKVTMTSGLRLEQREVARSMLNMAICGTPYINKLDADGRIVPKPELAEFDSVLQDAHHRMNMFITHEFLMTLMSDGSRELIPYNDKQHKRLLKRTMKAYAKTL